MRNASTPEDPNEILREGAPLYWDTRYSADPKFQEMVKRLGTGPLQPHRVSLGRFKEGQTVTVRKGPEFVDVSGQFLTHHPNEF